MDETLELTAEAERLGASGALVVTPYYGRPQQQGLYDWYSRVASEFPDLPLLVYNVPIRAAVDITPATVGRLRRAHANIVGIKETTKDFEHVSYVLDECGTDFIALSGIELLCYPMLCLGGRGHLSCVGNFAPKPVAELYDAFAAGDHERARAAPLRPARARRRGLRRDQSGAREVGHGATRPDRVGSRPRAARAALRGGAHARREPARRQPAHRPAAAVAVGA